MAKRVVGGLVASREIDQSLMRLEHSHGLSGTTRSLIDASWDAIGVSRTRGKVVPKRSIDADEQAVAPKLLLAVDDDAISQFVDDLAAAYAAARETGDDVGVEIYGKALETIGRYLALEIGPKAAGIKLS